MILELSELCTRIELKPNYKLNPKLCSIDCHIAIETKNHEIQYADIHLTAEKMSDVIERAYKIAKAYYDATNGKAGE